MKKIIFALSFISIQAYIYAFVDNSNPTNCKECHTCDKPSTQALCLHPCPRHETTNSNKHNLSEGPGIVFFKDIAEHFTPVKFDHRAHADMSSLGVEKCNFCHHFTPPGKIQPCRDCHTKNSEDLKRPGLKGAYHRQCLGCHREWSHDNKCFSCHENTDKKTPVDPSDKSDIIANAHPKIQSPQTLVYKTPYRKAPIVTFHHGQHIKSFGLQCVNCHEKFTCGNCHDSDPNKKKKRTMQQVHQSCDKCHRADNCSKCHSLKEMAPFNHADKGWKLNYPHSKLACKECHKTPEEKPKKECKFCHKTEWTRQNFNHNSTGLKIDAAHSMFECSYCHSENNTFKVFCNKCHFDGRDPKKKPVGEYLTL
ncbi:MAG: hypothetical protein A2504_13885 [Bdellovibrionales bacterium RIFOXYD12_FULL_39_22]|nr:MAG: hypothetical protein A2385_00610 [Bdellovibrionales bacterium RIFOXYB1_FULL_39_21]OFZ43821.1 MAG: hypothetical protein A2485_04920 [Bdellovibrionales bacterium RIFOXYC12_FULL_39_17]OFZ48845.1 MAG: hypothetical protein A2404_17925 [Bdellovibrionales bacterium RIFOXYC1_FULL_39_130]OFZ72068.1 MAG: hypothetical protein A2451_05520 [Bdellovibrionales bacterium RIFOXYC2_FULL_39_8]OFZ76578.1 MAG: hypothetical protein A2560_06590 [Bdellovibrionales bacterium RIFOXYD1_FULL_39_84]OFZ94812.1 MAG: